MVFDGEASIGTPSPEKFSVTYINLLFTKKLVAHKNTQKTNLNKLNQRATCSQISQHGERALGRTKLNCPDNLKLHAYLMF